MSNLVEREDEIVIDDDDRLYEVIDGERVEKAMGYREVLLANDLHFFIKQFIRPRLLGTVGVEILFDFVHAGRPQRRPDLAYVSAARWPVRRKKTTDNAWSVVPDLAAEVLSPSNSADEVQQEIEEYFAAGVRLVWVIFTTNQRVHVYESTTNVRIIDRDGILEGGEVLPGFRLPLVDLFEEEESA